MCEGYANDRRGVYDGDEGVDRLILVLWRSMVSKGIGNQRDDIRVGVGFEG